MPLKKRIFDYLNPNYRLKFNYRLGRKIVKKRTFFYELILAYLKYRQTTKFNSQISYKAKLHHTVFFPHPLGIVIGDDVEVGKNVWIWQNVTLGSHGKKNEPFAYPIIHDNVRIYAGAVIIGKITIGENAIIGANAVVLNDVPANSVAVGIPAKIITKNK